MCVYTVFREVKRKVCGPHALSLELEVVVIFTTRVLGLELLGLLTTESSL